jgi:phage terminase small subunit
MVRKVAAKDEKFLAGKRLGGRPAVVEERITRPVKPHKPKVLSPQEWKFVEEFVAGDGHVTLKEAAIRAGYGESWARNRARELTDPDMNPHMVAAIQERRRELGEKYATTFERHMRDLQIIRDQALTAGAYGAAVQAEYRRGQALGTIYIDRKEIRHGTIDSMSKEEVQRKLEEIRRLYGGQGGPIVDVTPKQIEEEPVEDDGVVDLPDLPDSPAPENEEEEENDGTETGIDLLQEAERKRPRLPFHPD